jgi:hypothetical protein
MVSSTESKVLLLVGVERDELDGVRVNAILVLGRMAWLGGDGLGCACGFEGGIRIRD